MTEEKYIIVRWADDYEPSVYEYNNKEDYETRKADMLADIAKDGNTMGHVYFARVLDEVPE